MRAIRYLIPLLLAAALLATACSDDSTDTAADDAVTDTAATDTAVDDTPDEDATADEPTAADAPVIGTVAADCDEVAAAFTTAGSANADLPEPEASATCEGDTIVVSSNGIPDYTYIETSPGAPTDADLTFTIPATPTIADEPTAVPALGSAAVSINGIPIYGPTEGQGGDVLSLEGGLSECGSHNGPTGFHMHLFGTSETTDCLYSPEEVAEGPQLFGYAFDGYPIYTGNGIYESSWELTDESLFATDTWSAHTYVEGSGDLDQCNGLTDADGNYAYYTTDTFPYVLGCYTGDVELAAAGGGAGELGPPPA